jgi:hypothetical protein
MREYTDVRLTQNDGIPITGISAETLTNGAAANEVWKFSEVWLHEQLGQEP